MAAVLSVSSAASSQGWRQYERPEDAGFSSAALDQARRMADSLQSGAVFVVSRGSVVAAWGDVSRKFQMHSARKTLTSALYGIAVGAGRIELGATLGALGIGDRTPLTAQEKTATVRDLISARSGVYLTAAYAPADQDSIRPPRDSHAPGTFWMYNNWDFNAAELVFEQRTGKSPYAAFAEQVASPLHMDDFAATDGFTAYEPSLSNIGAHTWRMSARDLARLGRLYIQDGKWDGRQVIPSDWVKESTTPHSDLGQGRGYGYMWWTYAPGSYGTRYPTLNRYRGFAARGLGGQMMMVIPEAALVVVHRADTDHNRNWPEGRVLALIDAILAARVGEPSKDARLVALAPTPFASQLPALARPQVLPMSDAEVDALVGEYEGGMPQRVRVTRFLGKAFMFVPGRGEAELLKTGEDQYTIDVVPGVSILAERDGSRAGVLRVSLGGRTIVARRTP